MEGAGLTRDGLESPQGSAFTPLVIPGSDPRLQSEYGTRDKDLLRISKVPDEGRRILYGPHISLPPGLFRFELSFDLEARGRGMVTVDLARAGGHRDFYLRRCFEWELQRGLIRISHALQQSIDRFELRLYAGTGFVMAVKQLAVFRLGEPK
ncbi:hypothetical protein [Reyranella massiliensis]|uniref:hypothetical protein n=1 Tax=Reyranella massiliensis TaxID=445220 RepID=UPI00031E8F0B|nr:hypothetical protein [Reyranella massiliensis]